MVSFIIWYHNGKEFTCLRLTAAGFFLTAAGVAPPPVAMDFPVPGPDCGLLTTAAGPAGVDGVIGGRGSSSDSITSLVELVIDMDLTGRVLLAETFLVGFISLGVVGASASSFGMAAILVRNNFSSVCAMTTISSPALL